MQALRSENCLTCLSMLKLDSDCMSIGKAAHSVDIKLQRLLTERLDWRKEELEIDLIPNKLCTCCFEQLQTFERFQRRAADCRQQLLVLLQRDRELELEKQRQTEKEMKQIARFEIVYDDQPTLTVETEVVMLEVETSTPTLSDPFEKSTTVGTRRRSTNSFKCPQCGNGFAHSLTLAAHVRKVHEGSKRPFQCDRCDKAYSFMGGLYTHIREIHSPQVRSYTCDYPDCERVYISTIAMQKHKRLKHSIAPLPPARKYICEQCGATFNQTANLKYHRRSKHPTPAEKAAHKVEQHYCHLCEKSFHSRYTLKYHNMQKHAAESDVTGQADHVCQVCGRRMAKRFMLMQHMLMHSQDKIPCEHCGRLFARKFELEAHIRAVHLKIKPFGCKYCSESFASRKTLRHHEYIHTGEKPYICDVCGQAFRQQTCLKNHGRVHEKASSLPPQPAPVSHT